MLSTFNCGVGLIIVVSQQNTEFIMQQISNFYDCYEIGKIEEGEISVSFENHIIMVKKKFSYSHFYENMKS